MKRRTDVVVVGSAWAPGGKPCTRSEVRCAVGEVQKRIAVFGERRIEWSANGQPTMGAPEPFTSVPLIDDNAYGGMDPRVPIAPVRRAQDMLAVLADPPGRYPRNPVGKGYLVMPQPVHGVELPQLEDPDDLLDDDRLIVGDPAHWHRQPLPWTLGWQHPMSFARYATLGADAHFAVEDPSTLKEVKRGILPANYRSRRNQGWDMAADFHQEASLGMSFAPLRAGVPIAIEGVAADRRCIELCVPEAPHIEIAIDKQAAYPMPLLTAVVLEPDAMRVSLVYAATTSSLPRRFIPGVHPDIPLRARVDHGPVSHYVAPPVRRRSA